MSSTDIKEFLKDERNYILLIDKSKGMTWSGVLYHGSNVYGEKFKTPMEMAYLVEEICELIGTPSAVVEERRFKGNYPRGTKDSDRTPRIVRRSNGLRENELAFKVNLNHRYSASWQGEIEQVDTAECGEFGSFLELITGITAKVTGIPVDGKIYGKILEALTGRGEFCIDEDGMQWYLIPGASYEIKVLFQQNHSWQGIVKWLEAKESVRFRSFLELAKLTDVQVEETENAGKELQLG